MNKLLATASFAALALIASQSQAETWPKWYVGLSGGLTYLNDSDVSGTSTGKLGYDMGGVVTASLGYSLSSSMQPVSNMRVELEAGYHENSLDNALSTASPGKLRIASYMVNAFYDFRNGSQFVPYVGAGAGIAKVNLSHDSGLGNTGDDEDNTFAYQFMGGISYSPTGMPFTEWGLGYRYFAADSPEFDTAGGKVELDDVSAHTAEINAKFKF